MKQTKAVAAATDERCVSRATYSMLARACKTLPRKHMVLKMLEEEDRRAHERIPIHQVVVGEKPMDAYRRDLRQLLVYLVKDVYAARIKDADTIHALIQADGRQTGKGRHHFLITLAVLNAGADVLSPKHHYVLLLATGGESYEELDALLPALREEIEDLKDNGLQVDGRTRRVEVHMSADWKLLNCVMGLSGATANIFCPWCLLTKNERMGACERGHVVSRESVWDDITGATTETVVHGHVHHPLLPDISPAHTWLDPLHLFLRITDTLIGLLMEDLLPIIALDRGVLARLETSSSAAGAHIVLREKDGEYSWPPLQGNQKFKLFKRLDLNAILPADRAAATRALWDRFLDLHQQATRAATFTREEADAFKASAASWVADLTAPSFGDPTDADFRRGMYSTAKITPYMHALVDHLPDQLYRASAAGFQYRLVSCEPVEKMHHLQVQQYMAATAHDGGRARSSATLSIFKKDARRTARKGEAEANTGEKRERDIVVKSRPAKRQRTANAHP